MNFKLTFGVFAVIISTIEADVSKYDSNSPHPARINYDRKPIGEMAPEMIVDIANEDNNLYTWISPSQLDQWNTAIKGEYTGYRDTISRKGGPNVNEPTNLPILQFLDHLGRLVRVEGTVFKTSSRFPNLTIDAARLDISKRTMLAGHRRYYGDDPRVFENIARLIQRATSLWNNAVPINYEVSEVLWTQFKDDGVETARIRLNPNEGPIVKFYELDKVPYWLEEKRSRAEEIGASINYDFTITEPGRLTVIERFNLQSLAFPGRYAGIAKISFDAKDTALNLDLKIGVMEISADCYSVTEHDGVIHGSYAGPTISVSFEEVILETTSRWEDVDSGHSRITEAEIIDITFHGWTYISVVFDPRMSWLMRDMWINIDDLLEQWLKESVEKVKQSATAKDYLKTFLQSTFYEDNVTPVWAQIGNATSDKD